MAGALGDLVIALHADVAQFESDMGRAARISEREWKKVGDHVAAATKVIAIAAVAAGAAALKMGHDFIEAAANLDDLAEKTGASVEELSKLSQQAYISGQSMETVEMGLIRLSKALHGSDDEAKGAGKALQALGLQADDLRGKDTAVAFRIVAEQLNKYADGAGKTALVLDLFGKSGAQLLPILKDMANDGELSARVTAKQAAEAEELGKAWRRLVNDSSAVKQAIALELVPKFTELIEQFREGTKIAGGFLSALRLFGLSNITQDNAGAKIREYSEEIENLTAKRAKFVEQGRAGWTTTIDKQIADLEKQKRFAQLLQRQTALALGGADTPGEIRRGKPALNYEGAGDKAKDIGDMDSAYRNLLRTLKEKLLTDEEQTELNKLQLTLDAMSAKQLQTITPARRSELEDLARKVDLKKQDKVAQDAYLKSMQMDADLEQEVADLLAKRTDKQSEIIKSQYEATEQIEFETNALTMNNAEREKAVALRALEKSGLDKSNPEYERRAVALMTAIQQREELKEAVELQRGATDQITEFWRSAAEQMQQSMSDFFFNVMQGNLKDLSRNFKTTIDRMVANMLAAKAATALFGEGFGKSGGNIGGWVGGALNWLGIGGSQAPAPVSELVPNLVGSFASGSDYVPRTGLALVHQGEAIIPANENAGRGGVHVHNHFPVNVSRQSIDQASVATGRAVQRALERNT